MLTPCAPAERKPTHKLRRRYARRPLKNAKPEDETPGQDAEYFSQKNNRYVGFCVLDKGLKECGFDRPAITKHESRKNRQGAALMRFCD